MLIVLALYFLVVWMVFSKFKLLPWNRLWKTVVYGIAIVVALVVVGALQYYTPVSKMGVVQYDAQKIYPLVGGRIIEVQVRDSQKVSAGDILFRLDPDPFNYAVNQRKAALDLARIKLRDATTLVEKKAAARITLDKYVAEVDQAQALYDRAIYDQKNSVVVAPHDGIISIAALWEGDVVAAMTPVMNFIHSSNGRIATAFKQNGLENMREGAQATVVFSSAPGQIFETSVTRIAPAAVQGQITVQDVGNPIDAIASSTNLHPVKIELPAEVAPFIRSGAQASVTVFTDEGNPVNILAKVLQYISSWMNYVF